MHCIFGVRHGGIVSGIVWKAVGSPHIHLCLVPFRFISFNEPAVLDHCHGLSGRGARSGADSRVVTLSKVGAELSEARVSAVQSEEHHRQTS
jgi:hypothetical protein